MTDMHCKKLFLTSIKSLRLGEEGKFTTSFIQVIDCIQRWLQENPKADNQFILGSLEELMECQVNHNNIRLADILEYEIMPVMFN